MDLQPSSVQENNLFYDGPQLTAIFHCKDAGFLCLLANICPKYVMFSRKYFSKKIIPAISPQLHEEIPISVATF